MTHAKTRWIVLGAVVAILVLLFLLLRSLKPEWLPPEFRGPDIETKHGTVKEREIELFVSGPEEDKLQFLGRVGEAMVRFSRRTRTEACGNICRYPDGRFTVLMVTNDAVTMCAHWKTCPDGAKPVGENIHSHCPSGRRLEARAADEILTRGGTPRGTLIMCKDHDFSEWDYHAGPGFLATLQGLRLQEGKGTSTFVAPLARSSQPDPQRSELARSPASP